MDYLTDPGHWWAIDPNEFIRNRVAETDCTEEEAVKYWCTMLGLTYIPPEDRGLERWQNSG